MQCDLNIVCIQHLPQWAPRFWPIRVSKWDGPCSQRQVCAQCSALLSSSLSHTCNSVETQATFTKQHKIIICPVFECSKQFGNLQEGRPVKVFSSEYNCTGQLYNIRAHLICVACFHVWFWYFAGPNELRVTVFHQSYSHQFCDNLY